MVAKWKDDASAPFCVPAGRELPGNPRSVGQETDRGAQPGRGLDQISGKTCEGRRGWELPSPAPRSTSGLASARRSRSPGRRRPLDSAWSAP